MTDLSILSTPWRGPNPGLLGYLLDGAGRLLDRVPDSCLSAHLVGRPVWEMLCPVCDRGEGLEALLVGPRPHEFPGRDHTWCEQCNPLHKWNSDDEFSTGLWNAVFDRVTSELGYEDDEEALSDAREQLGQILPNLIDLDWPKEAVVRAAVLAIDRYGLVAIPTPRTVGAELVDAVRWTRRGTALTAPPQWVAKRAAFRLRTRNAKIVATNAVDFACIMLNRRSVTALDLLEFDESALKELAELLGFEGPLDAKAVGYLLKSICLKPGESGPGLVSDGKTNGRTRWKVDW